MTTVAKHSAEPSREWEKVSRHLKGDIRTEPRNVVDEIVAARKALDRHKR